MRRLPPIDIGSLREDLLNLITDFNHSGETLDLRDKVKSLVPAFKMLRDLGTTLISPTEASSAQERILQYFKKYPFKAIHGDELMVISGIQEWPRRVRELRVEAGWTIASGSTVNRMVEVDELDLAGISSRRLSPNEYVLLNEVEDRDAAHRWNIANQIRRTKNSTQDKILLYLQANVTRPVTGEELSYLAKDSKEWARRIRELRTEEGWPIVTRISGRPDLPVGSYLLEENRQAPRHDRHIPDKIRLAVLSRDSFSCRSCGWNQKMWDRSDPRHLELHHKLHHAAGGLNDEENLITLCTRCHDNVHRNERRS